MKTRNWESRAWNPTLPFTMWPSRVTQAGGDILLVLLKQGCRLWDVPAGSSGFGLYSSGPLSALGTDLKEWQRCLCLVVSRGDLPSEP